MAYFSFQLKKVIKSNLSVITLCILIIISFGVLYLNVMQVNNGTSIKGDAQGNIAMQQNVIAQDKQALKKYSPSSESYRRTETALKQAEKQLQVNQAIVKHINNNQWIPVYQIKINDIKKIKTSNLSDNERNFIIGAKKRYQYLINHPMPYESDAAITGNQLLLDLNQSYWPILFTLVIIVILTYLYTENYKNGLDITSVLPINKFNNLLISCSTGVVISCIMFFLLSLLVFTGSSLIFGTGSLQYPTIIHHLVSGHQIVDLVPLAALIPQFLILQILEFVFLALFIHLLAKLLHNQLSTLLLAVLIVIGMELSINVIVPFTKIAQWIPSTYLNSFKVVSGEIAYNLNNYQINFTNGLITLLIGTLILFILICLLDKVRAHYFKSVEEQ